jgi:hypothetical protein
VAAVVVLLLVLAASLVPALRVERGLRWANAALDSSPSYALSESLAAAGPATRSRVTATPVGALVRLGRLSDAERLARVDVRAHGDDPFAARRLYQVQRLRSRDAAARRTLRLLRRLDPKFADGTGF